MGSRKRTGETWLGLKAVGGGVEPLAGAGSAELVALCDRDGRVVAIEPEGARAWGIRDGLAAIGHACGDLGLPKAVCEAVGRGFARAAEEGRLFTADVAVASGVVECRVTPLPASADGADSILVVLRDVTEARRVERSVRDSEQQYRLLAENSSDMISRHDPSGAYVYVSPACKALVGFTPEQMLGRSAYDFIHPDDLTEVHRVHSTLLATAETFTIAFRGRRREGTYVWLETTTRSVRDPETGRVLEIQCATRDISRRKQAEQELRESRELLQAVLDNCPAVVYIKDADGRLLLINRRGEQVLKAKRQEVIGRTDSELFPADVAGSFRANDLKVIAARGPLEFEETAPQDDGLHTYLSVKFPLFDREGEPYAVCGISTDITARQRAETALREQSEILRSILDNMADAVVVADESEHFLVFNPAATRMFGTGATESTSAEWSQTYGLFLPDAVTPFPADELPLARAVRGEETNHVEMLVRHHDRPDGAWVLINGRPLRDDNGRPRGGVVVCHEITERKSAEEKLRLENLRFQEVAESARQSNESLKLAEVQLVQAEKLTSLGQLVAGVAHEINNPLAFVSNNLAVLERDVASLRQVLALYRAADPLIASHNPALWAEVAALAEPIDLDYTLESLDRLTTRSREGLRRIQQIVKDLRDFARLDDSDLQAVDLNDGVISTVNMIHGRALKHGVALDTDLKPLPPLTCYPGKINQVVMNLLSNAIDACRPGDVVTVRTEPAPQSDGVLIHVDDTGAGIDPAARDKIFDPFFTTKPVGQGTGLGLSITYGIVKAHGGMIAVDSTPGRGSRFTVKLPLVSPLTATPPLDGDAP